MQVVEKKVILHGKNHTDLSIDFVFLVVIYFHMFVFLVVLIPSVLIAYHVFNNCKKQQIISCVFFLFSIVVCVVMGLFGISSEPIFDSFFENFLRFFFTETFLPSVIVSLIFLLWSKDSVEYKVQSFFPLLAGFYSAYLPFQVLFSNAEANLFTVFVKPFLFLCMISSFSICVYLVYKAITEKHSLLSVFLFGFISLFAIICPALAESLWIQTGSGFVCLSSGVFVFILAVFLLAVLKYNLFFDLKK